MHTYIKAQAAAIIGSGADFLVSILLAEVFQCWYILANIAGNICGAALQFVLSRNWVFGAARGKVSYQAVKYIFFWAGNILLQAAGVFLFRRYSGMSYLLSKTIISVMVGVTYNYFAQKKFVFAGC
jgi:putative flippase GtrA